MNTERLNHLITVLERVKSENRKFDMSSFGRVIVCYDGPESRVCGTAACALGWAAFDPTFIEQGLCMVVIRYGEPKDVNTPEEMAEVWKNDPNTYFYPMFEKNYNFGAGILFFDITYSQCHHMFDPLNNPSINPRVDHVIAHVRDVLEGRV